MTPPSDTHPARTSSRWGLVIVVVTNVLLGVPAIVPLWLATVYLRNWPLASMGITERSSDDFEGFFLVGVPVVGFAVLAWLFIGFALRRRFNTPGGKWFWPVSLAAVLAPTAFIALRSSAT